MWSLTETWLVKGPYIIKRSYKDLRFFSIRLTKRYSEPEWVSDSYFDSLCVGSLGVVYYHLIKRFSFYLVTMVVFFLSRTCPSLFVLFSLSYGNLSFKLKDQSSKTPRFD